MKNWKLRTKLFSCFGLILAMLLLVGVASLSSLNYSSQINNEYTSKALPVVDETWRARRSIISIRRYLLNAMVPVSQAEYNEIKSALEEDLVVLEESLNDLEVLLPESQKEIQQIKSNMQEAEGYLNQIMDLAKNHTDAWNEDAYQIYVNSYAPLCDQTAELIKDVYGAVGTNIQSVYDQANQAQLRIMILIILAFLVAIAISGFAIVMLTRSVSKPLKEIDQAMRLVSHGELDSVEITYESSDEMGSLANNIRQTVEKLSFIIKDLDYGLAAIAKGDFTKTSANDKMYTGVYASLAELTYTIMIDLTNTVKRINAAAEQVSDGSDQVAKGAQALSQGATEQASAIQELTATIDQISENVTQNANSALQAKEKMQAANDEVAKSNEQMKQMILAMGDIHATSQKIDHIIKAIEDIAFQTNILALNAAVEAARAGSAGKGFAVVADEVRNLAQKSAEAARSTTALIEESVQAVERGARIADDTAVTMEQVVGSVAGAAQLVQEIAVSSEQQATSLAQATIGVDQIALVVQATSATAEESAATSAELSTQAEMLKELISTFQFADDDHVSSRLKVIDGNTTAYRSEKVENMPFVAQTSQEKQNIPKQDTATQDTLLYSMNPSVQNEKFTNFDDKY